MDQGKSVTLATIHGKGKAQANQKEKSKKNTPSRYQESGQVLLL